MVPVAALFLLAVAHADEASTTTPATPPPTERPAETPVTTPAPEPVAPPVAPPVATAHVEPERFDDACAAYVAAVRACAATGAQEDVDDGERAIAAARAAWDGASPESRPQVILWCASRAADFTCVTASQERAVAVARATRPARDLLRDTQRAGVTTAGVGAVLATGAALAWALDRDDGGFEGDTSLVQTVGVLGGLAMTAGSYAAGVSGARIATREGRSALPSAVALTAASASVVMTASALVSEGRTLDGEALAVTDGVLLAVATGAAALQWATSDGRSVSVAPTPGGLVVGGRF